MFLIVNKLQDSGYWYIVVSVKYFFGLIISHRNRVILDYLKIKYFFQIIFSLPIVWAYNLFIIFFYLN